MKHIWKKFPMLGPILACAVVALGAAVSLSGYTAPIFNMEDFLIVSAKEEEPEEEEVQEETVEEAKGSFDLEDGVYTGSAQGYAGTVKVAVTIKDHSITDIEILSTSDDAAFFNRAKKVIDSILTQQSLDVDTVSGATYSSKGIINAVKNALTGETEQKTILQIGQGDFDLEDGVYEGTGTGFGGEMKVAVTIQNRTITEIEILSHSDDESFLNRAKEGVISSILASQKLDVDTVSGATYSSKGIISAVKNALTGETEGQTVIGQGDFDLEDGIYTGSAQGYSGKVKVSVEIKDRSIVAIDVLSHSDDSSFFQRATGVIDEILASQELDVDTVSGATYSSKGIINAVKNALGEGEDDEEDETEVEKGDFPYPDGVYTGIGEGYGGDINVTVVLQDQTIKVILITDHKYEDDKFFNRAKAVADKIIKKQSVEVDVISGATYSSNGIIEGVKNALKAAEKAAAGETTVSETDKVEDQEPVVNTGDPSERAVYYGVVPCVPDEREAFSAYYLHVKMVLSNGKIVEISDVTGDGDSGNDRYIQKAVEGSSKYPGVSGQIIAKNSTEGVDTVSGATCTSKALINAVDLLIKAASSDGNYTTGAAEVPGDDVPDTPEEEETPPQEEVTEPPEEEITPPEGDTSGGDTDSSEEGGTEPGEDSETPQEPEEDTQIYEDGTYVVTVSCAPDEWEDFDEYQLTATVVLENDQITEIREISGDGGNDNKWYINTAANGTSKKPGVIRQILDKNSVDGIDTVSGATCSSNAIIEACRQALQMAKK